MLTSILIFIVSLIVLLYASEKFLEAAEKIGLGFGISPFVVGVTIVAFGTSLPELAASIASVYSGTSEIVVGNVIGSNITNILLVLGIATLVGRGISLDFNIWKVDMPILLGSAFLMYFTIQDGHLSMFEVILFLLALVAFLYNSIKDDKSDDDDKPLIKPKDFLMLIIGGVFVYLGAEYTVMGIEGISTELNISPAIISLTVVALGTSLPEVVVSIAAARRGKNAIAVGNVLGSNIFNTYAVMGIPSLLGTLSIPDNVLAFSLPYMIAVTLLFGIITISQNISKSEGMLLLLMYAYYLYEVVSQGFTS